MITTAIRLQLEPGQKMTLFPLSWGRFETILAELGERRSSRIAYANETLEIMTPLPEHERSKVLLADLVKTLLKVQKRRWESLGSTTFKREGIGSAIEPDDCFYIENYQAIIGKERINLNRDPSPDLAIEIDLTSKTEIAAYQALKIPELWIYYQGKLSIKILQGDQYIDSVLSPTFPNIPILEIIPQWIQRAKVVGMSQMLEEFEAWITKI